MTIQQYLTKIETLYKTGNAREHSYRGDLQNLIMAILPDVLVTNEPARVACGAPDYVLTRKDIPVGYIEAKDIGVDLGSKTLKEQFERYKSGLSNLIFTDYMDFHFYKDGELTTKIAIAKIEDGALLPLTENFEQFIELIKNFALTVTQSIKSPTKLAQMMAGKAKLMANVIEKSLNHDDEQEHRSQLKSRMLSFQQMLIHDIDNKAFADIYSQTIAYGMFAARYHDPTLPTFSRIEAAELIPKSNPFLRKLFQDIAGFDLDIRLTWIVDELVSIFLASDVAKIMKNFGRSTKQEDPVVHFYETFLGEYNPALRKARGVWYTPQPVVNFIVRAVDDILKTEFDLPQGLADTSKIKIKKKAVTQTKAKDAKIKEVETEVEVHKVQILDPAGKTGQFDHLIPE
ncbi:N-6 DNA methylase [Flavobacterium sp. T12S277]|uniref:N-6 DNA methylase n=1 Tax=Flavobacterium sp. T12S277 TaxID=3402752 RepID=UPI003AE807CC